MSDELKPCPFCGTTNIEQGIDDLTNYYIGCADCGCQVGNNDSKGLERWNRRAENAELRAKVEAQAIDERAAFEDAYTKQHAVEDPTIFQKWNDGEYLYANIRSAFEGWMIARAALNGAKQ